MLGSSACLEFDCRKASAPSEVYPAPSAVQKNMLHQKLTAKEHELRQALDKLRAADRQIKGGFLTFLGFF